MSQGGGLLCSCYFRRNIFIRKYNLHVEYISEQQFWKQYGGVLHNRGCRNDEERKQVVQSISDEMQRRKEQGEQSEWRRRVILESYKPLHPDVYRLHDSYIHPIFRRIVDYAKKSSATMDGVIDLVTKCDGERVYTFPVFTDEFCTLFMEEIMHFDKSGMPKGRPNTMNTSGILLRELGFYEHFMDQLREFVMPLAGILYPECCGETGLDSQRAFIVSYDFERDGDDTDLNIHFDNAEVTLNVSLNGGYQGGDLYLGGMRKNTTSKYTRIVHQRQHGILHRGQHMHGALPLESGRRQNLIIWMRSSSVRNKLCPMCDATPHLVPTQGEGDGFTSVVDGGLGGMVDVCQLT